jgi:hypothetical protein
VRRSSAIRKIDGAELSFEHTSRVVTTAATDFDPDLRLLSDDAGIGWPDDVERAVQEWIAGDTASLDVLGVDGYFVETAHVVLIVSDIE